MSTTTEQSAPTAADLIIDSTEEADLKDLSVILRSNVFPGSSYSSEEWSSVVKTAYHDHQISPAAQVGIYMRPVKDFRRKVHQYSKWMEKDIETKNLTRQWNAHLAESQGQAKK